MVLNNDGVSDPEGIKLRPVKGLKGCTYLDPGAITNALSYVMGPLSETLEVSLQFFYLYYSQEN